MAGPYVGKVAASTPFDGTEDTDGNPVTPPFVSDNVRDAIIEVRDYSDSSGIGGLVQLDFFGNGNLNNKWLGNGQSSHISNVLPLIVLQDSILHGYSFINEIDDADIDIELYVNGTLVKTFEVRNKRFQYEEGIINPITIMQGGRISVFLRKFASGSGNSNTNNPKVTIELKEINETSGSGGQQYGV
jgi:hypothetical protein